MNKNKLNVRLLIMTVIMGFGLCFSSCVDYLNKAPESTLTEKEVFGNFTSFQGWVEQMYACMANYHQRCAGNWYHTFNVTDCLTDIPMYWDDGNYWDQKFVYDNGSLNLSASSGVMGKYVWPLAWYAIRKANLGLEMLDLLEGTQEERNLIKGQCLYFRAFYHLELMQFWGGIPYVDEPLSVSEPIAMHRLSYRETALRAAEDFKAAAELLPLSWANTNTLVANTDGVRVTKIHAMGYLGRNLLYAASPMMNESSTGVNAYDTDLCKQAAEAFAEVIRLCEQSDSKYKLETWENWPKIFAVVSSGRLTRPGGTEVIQNQMSYDDNFVRWTTTRAQSPLQWGAGNSRVEVPAHNFVQYYHMANGLPIDDPNSGYDTKHPWSDREPRFYNDIVCHGTRMIINASSAAARLDEFAQLDNRGRHRHGSVNASASGSVSGYFEKRYLPLGCNNHDNQWENLQAYMPRLRLADIYIMYAEAVYYGYGSASSSFPGAAYSAQSAIEKIRSRAQLPPLPDAYYSSANFFETLVRERAVEFAFEGLRWFDLRRWNVAGELKYRQKTSILFDLDEATGEPINFQEVLMATRVYDKKHNWIPFQIRFTTMHEGFPQNPGW